MNEFAEYALNVAKRIQADADEVSKPPLEGRKPKTNQVIDFNLVKGTRRGYIERTVHQINGTYENGWYDACAVMLRRLIEILIIEAYEGKKIVHKIKDKDNNGNFFPLDKLINKAREESALNLTKDTKRILPEIKRLGDKSAHTHIFNANRSNFERLSQDPFLDIHILVQDLISKAGLK